MSVAVEVTLAIIIRTQTAVDCHSRKQLLQHLLGMSCPPPVFLDAGIPRAVEPEVLHRRITFRQLSQLVVRELKEAGHSLLVLFRLDVITPVRMAPVHNGEIEMHIDAFIIVSLYQLAQNIFLIGSLGYRILAVLARPQTESFVMLGGNLPIFHSHLLRHFRPGLGIELLRVPLVHQLHPLVRRNLCP